MCTSNSNKKEVASNYDPQGDFDWKKHMVIADRKRDTNGLLLPLQSYEEKVRRGMSFLLEDHLPWFKGPGECLIDENGPGKRPIMSHTIFNPTIGL